MEVDVEQLAQRVLRPEQPRLAVARAAVAEITEPREAWEALVAAGLVPPEAIDDPARSFATTTVVAATIVARRGGGAAMPYADVYDAETRPATDAERAGFVPELLDAEFDGARLRFAEGLGEREERGDWYEPGASLVLRVPMALPHPPTVAAAVALGAAFGAARQAEALAREAAFRLDRRDVDRRLIWTCDTLPRIGARLRPRPGAFRVEPMPRGPVREASTALERAVAKALGGGAAWYVADAVATDVHRGLAWQARRKRGANPFEPLVDAWRTGFAIAGLEGEGEGVCVRLVARVAEPDGMGGEE